MKTCNIFCDDYNKSNRSKICCPYCDFDVCRTCCETYILDESSPKCMKPGCSKEWSSRTMLSTLLTLSSCHIAYNIAFYLEI